MCLQSQSPHLHWIYDLGARRYGSRSRSRSRSKEIYSVRSSKSKVLIVRSALCLGPWLCYLAAASCRSANCVSLHAQRKKADTAAGTPKVNLLRFCQRIVQVQKQKQKRENQLQPAETETRNERTRASNTGVMLGFFLQVQVHVNKNNNAAWFFFFLMIHHSAHGSWEWQGKREVITMFKTLNRRRKTPEAEAAPQVARRKCKCKCT